MKLHPFLLTFILLASACSLPSTAQPTAASATQPVEQVNATPTQTPTSIAKTPEIPDRPRYILDTVVNYDLHSINVVETIQYPNHTGQELASLTLAIAANLWADCFRLSEAAVDGIPVTDYALHLHRLDLPLPTPLAPASVSTLTLRYSLSLPYMDQVNSQRARQLASLLEWEGFLPAQTQMAG